MRAFDLERAILAEAARVAEAPAMRAHAVTRAVVGALAPDARRAIDAIVPRLTVAPAAEALAVARAVRGTAPRLGAIETGPIEVALADTVHTLPVMRALVRASWQLHAAIDAPVALLTQARAGEADAVGRAIPRAQDAHVARLATPVGLTHAQPLPACAVPRAIVLALK